jgi:hypothetical protein
MSTLRLAIATMAIVIGCSLPAAAAESTGTAQPRCPEKYWLMGTLCINESTGDVVFADPAPSRDDARPHTSR